MAGAVAILAAILKFRALEIITSQKSGLNALLSKLSTLTAMEPICQCPQARKLPSEACTATISPSEGLPATCAIAPENTQG